MLWTPKCAAADERHGAGDGDRASSLGSMGSGEGMHKNPCSSPSPAGDEMFGSGLGKQLHPAGGQPRGHTHGSPPSLKQRHPKQRSAPSPRFDLPPLDPPFPWQYPPRAPIRFTHPLQRLRRVEAAIRSHHFDPSIFQLLPQPREYALPITSHETFEVASHPPASSLASPASSRASRRFSSSIGNSMA